jgi:hypothetical protein
LTRGARLRYSDRRSGTRIENLHNFQRRGAEPKTPSLRGIRGRADPGLTPKTTGAPQDQRSLGVAVYGTGRAGAEIVRACGYRDDLRLVAAVAVNPSKEGADLGAVTVGQANGVRVTCDLDSVLASHDVDVVLHAGLGDPRTVAAVLGRCADAGKDAITVSGLARNTSQSSMQSAPSAIA